jgi:hypothetical protein
MEFTKDELVICQVLRRIVLKNERERRNYKANPDKRKEQSSVWAKANRPKKRESSRKSRAANPAPARKRSSDWYKAHPEWSRIKGQNRVAAMRGSGGTYTEAEWQALKLRYGSICLLCKRTESDILSAGLKLVPDHVMPLARGGTNSIENIQPLCHAYISGTSGGCNNRKHAKHIDYRGKQCTL